MFDYLLSRLPSARRPALPLVLAALAGLPACGGAAVGADGESAGEPGAPLTERLAEPTELGVAPGASGSAARLRAVSLHDATTYYDVEVEILGGGLTLSLDEGRLRLHELAAAADDIHVGGSVDLDLTGIALRLDGECAAAEARAAGEAVIGRAGCAVELTWAAALDHGVVDLAPIRLPDLPLELVIEEGPDGAVEAHLTAEREGTFWSWAELFELRDLEIDLVAASDLPVSAVGASDPVD